jgi:hypothetical protein
MPMSLEPNRDVWVCLPRDAKKPPAERAEFLTVATTMRKQRELSEVLENLNKFPGTFELVDALIGKLREHVVGWRNVPHEFNHELWLDLLSTYEAIELLYAVMAAGRVDYETKKNSELQPSSAQE